MLTTSSIVRWRSVTLSSLDTPRPAILASALPANARLLKSLPVTSSERFTKGMFFSILLTPLLVFGSELERRYIVIPGYTEASNSCVGTACKRDEAESVFNPTWSLSRYSPVSSYRDLAKRYIVIPGYTEPSNSCVGTACKRDLKLEARDIAAYVFLCDFVSRYLLTQEVLAVAF